jgi:hypothetical protein
VAAPFRELPSFPITLLINSSLLPTAVSEGSLEHATFYFGSFTSDKNRRGCVEYVLGID